VFLGTHRDGFGVLYNEIRGERGYNYGDYSYIEWFEGRPFYLFPPANTPRRYQYFSLWVRPVQHEYAHHILKAITWEFENFVRNGIPADQCESAKNKAKVLYLNLAETSDRLLAYRLDDEFYGLKKGYLSEYLETIDKLTPEQINAAIKKYLRGKNLKYVIVTSEEWATKLKEDLTANRNARGKDPAAYNIDSLVVDGEKMWKLTEQKLKILQKDKVWEETRLEIPLQKIKVVKSDWLFESSE
jgi:zinc protease